MWFLFEEGRGAGKRDERRVRSGSWRSWRVRRKSRESSTDRIKVREEREGRGGQEGGWRGVGDRSKCSWVYLRLLCKVSPRWLSSFFSQGLQTQASYQLPGLRTSLCVCVRAFAWILFPNIYIGTAAVDWVSERNLISVHKLVKYTSAPKRRYCSVHFCTDAPFTLHLLSHVSQASTNN